MESSGKIAFYLSGLFEGGAENVMVILANEFARRSYKVDFVLAKAEGSFLRRLSPDIHIVDLGVSNKYLSLGGLVKYFLNNSPVVMLSTLHVNNMFAVIAKKIVGKSNSRVVIRVATFVSGQRRVFWKKWLEKTALSIVYPWADAIISVSKNVSGDLAEFLNLSGKRISTIYNPSVTDDLLKFAEIELDHPWFQPGEPPVVLGVGRLTPDKGYASLIKAFASASKIIAARLVILGDGDQRTYLESLVHELGISENVEIVGFVDNPFQYMKRAQVLVLASLWEGLPNVLIEALGCGCPVISTDCPGGVREILDNGKYGRLVPMNNHEALVESMVDALKEKKVQANTDEWLEQFKTDSIVKQYIDVLTH